MVLGSETAQFPRLTKSPPRRVVLGASDPGDRPAQWEPGPTGPSGGAPI